jgi:hypothetical protein
MFEQKIAACSFYYIKVVMLVLLVDGRENIFSFKKLLSTFYRY